MDDQPDDNPVDKGHAVVETVGYGMLPERLKKQIKKMEQQLRKEGIDTHRLACAHWVGMTQEEFDEKNVCERKRLTVCFEKSNWKRTRKLWNLIIF